MIDNDIENNSLEEDMEDGLDEIEINENEEEGEYFEEAAYDVNETYS